MIKTDVHTLIVGSGAAGSTLALRLLEQNRAASILILEAGPEIEAKNRRYWWDYVVLNRQPYAWTYDQPGEARSIGNTNYEMEGVRVNAYGGSTMHWGGWSLRYKPEDFELRSRTGDGADWPISYDDLEPYYCEAEQHLSVGGDDPSTPRSRPMPMPAFDWTEADGEMLESFERLGIAPAHMPIARYRKCMTTGTCKYCPLGSRYSAQLINDELRADPRHTGFRIQANAIALKVLTDGRRATGVRYRDNLTGEERVIRAERVIVASGAFESPKLLMLSRSREWPDGIGNTHDLLGRFVVTHSILVARGRSLRNDERWVQEYDFPTLMSRTYDSPEYQKGGKIFLFKNRALPNVDIAAQMIKGLPRAEVDAVLGGPREQELQAFMEESGRFNNRVTIAPGYNRFGMPKMRVDFSRTDDFNGYANIRLNLMEKVIKDMGYTLTKREVQDPGGHHTTGTARMAATPDEGVVDKDLLVFGTDNLYVCSNAVFPSGSAVNPTLTLTALAMRLGDHLNARGGSVL